MKNKRYLYLAVLGVVIIVVALIQLTRISFDRHSIVSEYENLKKYAETEDTTKEEDTSGSEKPEADAPVINNQYLSLYKMNTDFVGWLKVDGTSIDYPVMQSQSDPTYYLNHAFSKKEDSHGAPFMDSACKLAGEGNYIIYGHNMLDGTMFDQLSFFTEKKFCEEKHPIEFDTLYENISWNAVMVFKITYKDTEIFPYYTFTDFEDGKSYGEFMEKCKNHAVWYDEDGIKDPARLLILSTCDNSYNNGRIVVLAKRADHIQ